MKDSVTLRRAREGDLPALIALWQAIFDDDEDYIRAFYSASGIERTVVAVADGSIVGMINCPEVELWAGGERYRGAYVYALAVDAHYRGRAIASALLKAAEGHEYLPEAPQFLLLMPAEASLFDFYGKKGYDRPAFAPLVDADAPELEGRTPLAHDSDILYAHYLAACEAEAADGAVFVKGQALFALSMDETDCYTTADGYAALGYAHTLVELRPARPDLGQKAALWKAIGDIPKEITPLISRFMED